ncbi:MAG: radical SAM/SPASM domain-containing protein [Rhizobium sp.]|nr:MAG: radical SAM/SPASM domain-containing protein [Rhizobium sp.]
MRRRLEVTTNIGCSLACAYCPQSVLVRAYRARAQDGERRYRVMSRAMFSDYIATVPTGTPIHFSGFSEPFHAPDCLDMIADALSKGHEVQLFSVVDRISATQAEQLLEFPLSRFVIHVPDANGLMKLQVTEEYLNVLKILARDPRVEFLTIGVSHPMTRNLLSRINSTRRVHDRAGNILIQSPIVGTAYDQEETRVRLRNGSIVCRSDRMLSNVLLPNGDVQFCAMDYALRHTIGNLARQSYQEIVTGPEIRQLIHDMADDSVPLLCRTCEYAIAGSYGGFDVDTHAGH